MSNDPASLLQDYLVFGEYDGVNPSINDSSTYTFRSPEKMALLFEREVEGCFLYSRHTCPTIEYLDGALAIIEGTEAAHSTASGMSAIACSILQICGVGDEIISSRTIYGGTYALFKNFLSKLGINTHFVPITDIDVIRSKITEKTKILYCESISNPLLEVANIPELRKLCDEYNLKLIVDNTFSPLIISPYKLGADIVIYSLTKFINGASDCVAGAICADKEFILSLKNVNNGATMLLGPTLDSLRAQSILKNMRTLHVRMQKHSYNAQYLAEKMLDLNLNVHYPGLKTHPQHDLMRLLMNEGYGFGGMLTLDAITEEIANNLIVKMQEELVGYFAVSLGFYKTLFSPPGHSTSSEIPEEEQRQIGLTPGLIRFSIGLDNDIDRTWNRMVKCFREVGLIK